MTTSIAAEDSIALAKDWKLRLGLSHDQRDAKEVYYWPTGSTSATNGLAELSHALGRQGTEVYGVLSHKTRFPPSGPLLGLHGVGTAQPDLKPRYNHLSWAGRALGWRR